MPRAPPLTFLALTALVLFLWYIYSTGYGQSLAHLATIHDRLTSAGSHPAGSDASTGYAIMAKLDNETAKAELGRAAWKLFHTTMARFPNAPTADESKALKDYIYLFARLYPCGECATHFQQILKRYPPQVSSRSTAAAWACFVHNEVNISKDKPVFDCANIGDWYDCGCADDEESKIPQKLVKPQTTSVDHEGVEVEKDGLINGG